MKKQTVIKIKEKYEKLVRFGINHGLRLTPLRKINRAIHSVLRKSTDKFKESKVKIGNNTIYLDSNDSLGLSMNTNFEPAETELIRKTVKEGDIVLDIGANIGVYTVMIAEIVGEKGKVYAFEPDPTNFAILKKNVEINGYKNVILIDKAVSSKKGKLKLFLCEENTGDHKIYDSKENRKFVEIESIRLDDYFSDYKGKIDFIKMDVEGSEPGVINGASKILTKNTHLKIVTEFYPMLIEEYGYSYEQYLKDIFKLGFSVYDIEGDKNRIQEKSFKDLFKKINPSLGNGTNLFCVRAN